MPSGKKDIYGNPSKALYKAGTIRAERAAAANRDPERARRAMQIVAQEGITRGPERIKPASKPKPAAPLKKPQVTRTTTDMKPTPERTVAVRKISRNEPPLKPTPAPRVIRRGELPMRPTPAKQSR